MPVDVVVDGARADIVLNRPDIHNALDWEMFDDLARAATQVADEASVRVVVVSGAGRSFCSGIDTSAFGELAGDAPNMIGRAQAGYRKLAELEVPTIASVRGHALGAGLQIALMCDVRVVTSDASLGLLEAQYAIVPDLGGTQRLPRLVGAGRAKKMIWLAERVTGDVAHQIGLAEQVVEPDELARATDDIAARIAEAPPLVVRAVKSLVEGAHSWPLLEGMDREGAAQAGLLTSSDFGEAIAPSSSAAPRNSAANKNGYARCPRLARAAAMRRGRSRRFNRSSDRGKARLQLRPSPAMPG